MLNGVYRRLRDSSRRVAHIAMIRVSGPTKRSHLSKDA